MDEQLLLHGEDRKRLLRSVRVWLSIFMLGLVISGLTAFPLLHETAWVVQLLGSHPVLPQQIIPWIMRVHLALAAQAREAPFLAYGTDWLAFAHLMLAVAFIGPVREPVRNRWMIQFGLIACASVPLLALIAGPVRGIPLPWRLVDCCFGVFGAIPLWLSLACVRRLEALDRTAWL